MISICIPVYNVDIRNLVNDLSNQAQAIDLKIEILVFDDGSTEAFKEKNRQIIDNCCVVYKELKTNRGCASIRNQMATDAHYDNLIFIDSDSELNKNYLRIYSGFIDKFIILCGGRVHPTHLPSEDKRLRWIVGKSREDFNADERSKIPNKSFMSNNFMVKKELFNYIEFNEKIERSGHEDTMLGIEMERLGIHIKHINNPVIHIGLESNNEFINKSKQRIETLLFLFMNEKVNGDLMKIRIKLLKYFLIIKKLRATYITSIIYQVFHALIEKNLKSKSPNMILFDIYKLTYLSNIYCEKK